MKKSLFKFLLRKITKNLSGFITISIIVALGVGFLVGLLVTTSDLQSTIDAQHDSMKIADITLKSTVGFDDSCIETLNNNLGDDIEYIQGYYQMDEHAYYDNERLAARTIYYDFEGKNINLIELEEGRKPEAENEVVVESVNTTPQDAEDEIETEEELDVDLNDNLEDSEMDGDKDFETTNLESDIEDFNNIDEDIKESSYALCNFFFKGNCNRRGRAKGRCRTASFLCKKRYCKLSRKPL